MISKILLEKIIACVDESNKGECWLCNDGSQMRVVFEVIDDLVYITFRSFSNRVVVNKKAKVKFSNNPEILRLLCSDSTQIK